MIRLFKTHPVIKLVNILAKKEYKNSFLKKWLLINNFLYNDNHNSFEESSFLEFFEDDLFFERPEISYSVFNITPIPHNGCRPPKPKR